MDHSLPLSQVQYHQVPLLYNPSKSKHVPGMQYLHPVTILNKTYLQCNSKTCFQSEHLKIVGSFFLLSFLFSEIFKDRGKSFNSFYA